VTTPANPEAFIDAGQQAGSGKALSAAAAQRSREIALLRAGGSLSADRTSRAAAIARRKSEIDRLLMAGGK
jgi:hypothetical protein